jgi:hypothetical protein
MVRVAGAGDGQHVRPLVQGPGQAYLVRGRIMGGRDGADGRVVVAGRAGLALRAGDCEEGHERDASLGAGLEEFVVGAVDVDGVAVLDTDDGCDGLRLVEVGDADGMVAYRLQLVRGGGHGGLDRGDLAEPWGCGDAVA